MSTSTARARSDAPRRRWDLLGRGLMAFNAVLTFAVFIYGLTLLASAEPELQMVQGWRAFGWLVFACMWAMLALFPRHVPAIWELVILHKVAATILAFAIRDTEEGAQAMITDSWVAASTIFAYVVCRGWQSWRVVRSAPVSTPAVAA